MKLLKLIFGFYSHDDREYKDFYIKIDNKFVKERKYYLFPVRNTGVEGFYIGFSMNCQNNIEMKRKLYTLNQDIELEKLDKYEFQSYENETYYEEIVDVAIFKTEEDYNKSQWNSYYVILDDIEELIGDLLFIKEINDNSFYVEKYIHNISKIKFSSDFNEVLDIYSLNEKFGDELWYDNEEEKKESFDRIKNEIKELVTEKEFKDMVKDIEIGFSIINEKFSLLNQIN